MELIRRINLLGLLLLQLTLSAQVQGPNNAGTITSNASSGVVAWATPTSAGSSNDSYTSATNGVSNVLKASNFGFSIPSNATINGITIDVERFAAPVSPVAASTWSSLTAPNYASGTATSSYGSTSYAYNLPVSAASNNKRLLVVTVGIENVDNASGVQNPDVVLGSVTYNGVAMTLASQNSRASANTSNHVAVYYLLDSGLPSTTGSRSIVVNKSFTGELAGGIITPNEFVEVVGVNTFTNVDQLNPITAVSQTVSAAAIVSPAISNLRNGDFIVASTVNNTPNAAGNISPGAGSTEAFETSKSNVGAGGASGANFQVQQRSLTGMTGIGGLTSSANGTGASRLVMVAFSVNSARVYDNSVMLSNALGLSTGGNQALPSSLVDSWPDADSYQSYGGPSNLWGATWTPADINSANFGISFQVNATNSIANIDHIRISVQYSLPLSTSIELFELSASNQAILATISYNMENAVNYTFVLERMDGAEFVPVDLITVGGTSNMYRMYLEDKSPIPGNNYYRLKIDMRDQEHIVQYSRIENIQVSDEKTSGVSVYPNPAKEFFYVDSDEKILGVEVFDLTGNRLGLSILAWGENSIRVDNTYPRGAYTVLIKTEAGIEVKKVMVN